MDLDAWIARLAGRAGQTLDLRIHDKNAKAFLADRRVRRSGTNSLLPIGDGLVGGTERLNVWVSNADFSALRTEYGMLRSAQANLRVRLASEEIFTALPPKREVFSLIVAADLWDEGNARSQRAASQLMESIEALGG